MFEIESSLSEFETQPFRTVGRVYVRPRTKERPCPAVSLICNSVSASRSKCGFGEFSEFVSDPPKFYSTASTSTTVNVVHPDSGVTSSGSGTREFSYPTDGEPDTDWCEPFISAAEGSFAYTDPTYPEFNANNVWEDEATRQSFSNWGDNIFIGEYLTFPTSEIFTHDSATTEHHTPDITGTDYTAFSCYGTLTDEFTTSDLIANTEEALPDYAPFFNCEGGLTSGQDCECSAVRNLSTDEISYSIRRFQHKFKFGSDLDGNPITVTGYLKIYWNEKFVPTLTEMVVFDSVTYHPGDPDPDCSHWTITAKTWTLVDGATATETHVFEVMEPATNGTTTISNIAWSIDPDYHPVRTDPMCDENCEECEWKNCVAA